MHGLSYSIYSMNLNLWKNDAGFFPPTSGTAFVNGFDIRRDIDKVRKSLGLCPQHNVLYDDLTVEEHLIFFTKVPPCYFYSRFLICVYASCR